MRPRYKKNKISFEEILIDKKVITNNESYERLETPISEINIAKVALVVLIIFFVLFGRIFYLSVVKGQENYIISERNRLRYILIKAPRGVIYDRYNKPIVSNKTSLSLILLPRDYYQSQQEQNIDIIDQVAQIFEIPSQDLSKIVGKIGPSSYEPVLIKTNINSTEARLFEAKIKEIDRMGFHLIEDYNRSYYDPLAFSHIVGYIGRMDEEESKKFPDYPIADLVGKFGLESKYEKYLHGISGKKMLEVDARLKMSPELGIIEPKSGNRVVTTIDRDLQKFLYEAMIKTTEKLKLSKASAIMTNPKTGEVLAMVSIPSMDVEAFSTGSPKEVIQKTINDKNNPFINRIISGLYAPGSTIKPLVALAALKEKLIDPLDKIRAGESIIIPNPYNPDKPAIFRD